MSSRIFLLISLASLLSVGCKVYDPSLVADAGTDCIRRAVPDRPNIADDEGAEAMYFGLRNVGLDQEGGRWREIGYDLDGVCTEPPEYAQACEPAEGALSREDGVGGIDNTFGADVFPLVEASVPGLEETAREAQELGVGLPVFRMEGWNGRDNDHRVNVTITQSVFAVAADEGGVAPSIHIEDFHGFFDDDSPATNPKWDGWDYTWLRADTFLSGDPAQPLIRDDNAYVIDRTVVVRLPDRVEIVFPADEESVVVRLTGGVATGVISEDLSTLEDVIVAGRWSVVDLLRTAENVGVCMGTAEYQLLQRRLETIADVRSDFRSEGEGVPCDAISMAVTFTGTRLRFGGVTVGPTPVLNCPSP